MHPSVTRSQDTTTTLLPVLADAIPGFFDQFGWRYERRGVDVFRTGFVGDAGAWDIWVHAKPPLVVFVISPLFPRPDGVAPGPMLLHAMLLANHQLNLAKLAVDDDDDVALSVELPTEGFCYERFRDALTALVHYADEFTESLEQAEHADAARRAPEATMAGTSDEPACVTDEESTEPRPPESFAASERPFTDVPLRSTNRTIAEQMALLGRYFEKYGWRFDRVGERALRTNFLGKTSAFAAVVNVSEHWVVLGVNPFVRRPRLGFGPAALRLLGTANHHEALVKIGLDDDDDVFLSVELPLDSLDYAAFASALTALSHSADRLLVPLMQAIVIDDRNAV
jgi:hypothetical protein